MKNILFIVLLILNVVFLYPQNLTVFDLNTTGFPILRAKFYAFGTDGKQITNLSVNDFDISENLNLRKVIKVSCIPQPTPINLSSVLVMDASGSMKGENLIMAKEAAKAWIELLPANNSECAVTSFDDQNYIIQDFTNDRKLLLKATNSLFAKGGTDYNSALLNPLGGGLQITNKGKFKRVIVMLTDGMPNKLPDIEKIINEANKQNVVVYAVNINMNCPDVLKIITKSTGGLWFENVRGVEEIKLIYKHIFKIAQGNGPCEIEWESKPECKILQTTTIIRLKSLNSQSEISYQPPENSITKLEIYPPTVFFKNLLSGTTKDTSIMVKAINGNFNISGIKYSKSSFSISPDNFALTSGDSINLVLTFTPTDSNFTFCKIDFESDVCPQRYYATGGFESRITASKTLKLTHPNGGEIFAAGSDSVITWTGISPMEEVTLEFSRDNGKIWNKLTDSAIGFYYKWENIPKPKSSECLISVKQKPFVESELNISPVWSTINFLPEKVDWSPDGNICIASGSYKLAFIDFKKNKIVYKNKPSYYSSNIGWKLNTPYIAYTYQNNFIMVNDLFLEKTIDSLPIDDNGVNNIIWNPDGTKLSYINYYGNICIADASTGKNLLKIQMNNKLSKNVVWSPNGKLIAAGLKDFSIMVWNAENGSLINTLTGHSDSVNSIEWSPDSKNIVSGSNDSTIRVWDVSTGKNIKILKNNSKSVLTVDWSKNGNFISSGSDDKHLLIWDYPSFNQIKNIIPDNKNVNFIKFHPVDSRLASISPETGLFIYDYLSSEPPIIYSHQSGEISSLKWSQDEKHVLSVATDSTLKIWNAETGNLEKIINLDFYPEGSNWSPDYKYLALFSYNQVKVYESTNFKEIRTLSDLDSAVSVISWDPASSKILIGNSLGTVVEWNFISDKILNIIENKNLKVKCISYSNDGLKTCIGYSNGYIKICYLKNGKEFQNQWSTYNTISTLDWNPDDKFIITGSSDGYINLWNAETGTMIKQITVCNSSIRFIKWNKLYNTVIWIEENQIRFWNDKEGILPNKYFCNLYVPIDMIWNEEGIKIVSLSKGNAISKWFFPNVFFQQDISDSLFQIVEPKILSKDIDMNRCILGSEKDSIITAFIKNENVFSNKIDSIYFFGIDAKAFSIVSGTPPFGIMPLSEKNIEFRFRPIKTGIHSSGIAIITQSDTLYQKITGEGKEKKIEIIGELIDFGLVEVLNKKDSLNVVTIKNISNEPVFINKIVNGGPNFTDFSIMSVKGGFLLNSGDTCKMNLSFKPGEIGRTSGTLEFHYDGFGSPAVVQLFGEGFNKKPEIAVKFDKFKDLICNNSSSVDISVSNTGGSNLIINEINLEGNNSNEFNVNVGLPLEIEKDSYKKFSIAFIPKTAGIKATDVIIKSNAFTDSVLTVSLSAKKDIIMLLPEKYLIDLGVLCPGEMKDTSLKILNKGTIGTGAWIEYSSVFSSNINGFYVDTSNIYNYEFRYNGSEKPGQINEKIFLYDSLCGNKSEIEIVGNIVLSSVKCSDLSVSSFIGDSKECTLEINNKSVREVIITDAQGILSPFSILPNQLPLKIEIGKKADLKIIYKPSDSSSRTNLISLIGQPCDFITEASITGIPLKSFANIKICSAESFAGEEIEIPIVLNNSKNLTIFENKYFNTVLTFNPTLLLPLDYPVENINYKLAKIKIENVPLTKQTGDTLIKLKFIAGLGNAEDCSLELSNAESTGGFTDISVIDGTFHLLGICYEGGARLLNPNNKVDLLKISPNPNDGNLAVELNLLEKGASTLSVYNSNGELMFEQNLAGTTAKIDLNINTKEFATGLYFVSLQTPTIRKVEQLVVFK